jgi:hypothetical protein
MIDKCKEILQFRQIHVVAHALKIAEEQQNLVRAIAKDCGLRLCDKSAKMPQTKSTGVKGMISNLCKNSRCDKQSVSIVKE